MPVTSEPLFCRGCNEAFAVATADRRCPQCGQALTARELAPTLDLDLTLMAGPGPDVPEAAGPSEALIGKPFEGYTIDSFLGKGGMAWVFAPRITRCTGRARSRSWRRGPAAARTWWTCSWPRLEPPRRWFIRTS